MSVLFAKAGWPESLARFGWLVPLLFAAGIQGSAAGCSDGSGPSCLAVGARCGFFSEPCCAGLNCSAGECR